MPEMDSMSDDFPALCDPRTTMTGMSRSRWALRERKNSGEQRMGSTVALTPSLEGD